ncbi:phosphoglycerol transferase [Clostridia bacterium]|nr:phosphoglycerol transferase [Clostridia bacterium]
MKKLREIFKPVTSFYTAHKTVIIAVSSQIFLMFFALITAYMAFYIGKPDATATLGYINEAIASYFVSALVLFIIAEILYLLTYVLYVPTAIVYAITFIASVVNAFKLDLRGEPLVFTDLLLLAESADIAGKYTLDFGKYLPVNIVVLVVLLAVAILMPRLKMGWIKRTAGVVAAAAVAFGSFFLIIVPQNTIVEKAMKESTWNVAEEYKKNGFIISFVKSAKRSIVFAPKHYSEANLTDYAKSFGYNFGDTDYAGVSDADKPNVIVIMNESYFDANHLTGVKFTSDPMEAVRELYERSGSVRMLSPQLGGGTANVEYEFLTGKNTVYFPPSSMVYNQFINEKKWSLAWYFREMGYTATAIHPYLDWFWKRNTVYPHLGFENIYFKGNLNYIDVNGAYISDKAVSDEIISRYDEATAENDVPIFTFAVTMQNHGEYYASRYKDKKIKLVNQLNEDDTGMLETFFEGVRYASEAYMYLTEYFADVERPTYIIMFGDHAPSFAYNKELYAMNENADMSDEDRYNRYRTPIIFWSNTGEKFLDDASSLDTLTPQMLSVKLIDMIGLPKNGYYTMLDSIFEYTHGYTDRYTLGGDGKLTRRTEPPISDIYEKLNVIQYDAALGKRLVIDEFK